MEPGPPEEARRQDRRLGDHLVQRGLVTREEVSRALDATTPGQLGATLCATGRLSEGQLADAREALRLERIVGSGAGADVPAEVRTAAGRPRARVGRYVLVEPIGEGGMGEVWKAWDQPLGRWVAVKLLKTTDTEIVQRFQREASLAAQLSHPNVTRVHEVAVHEERVFLAMELVDGASPREERHPPAWAARVVRDAARGVQHAHEHGIVHRDMKPSNLLVTADDHVSVTDFGLARKLAEGGSLTVSGAVLGSPAYMAPEQARGLKADERTDVYGLGATLFALLEGSPPITGDSVTDILERAAAGVAPALSRRDDLAVIVRKAMEREPADRYASAGDLADDLDRFLAGESIRARSIGLVGRGWRMARRHPVPASLVATALVLAVGAAVWGVQARERQAARREAEARADAVLRRADAILDEIRLLRGSDRRDSQAMSQAVGDHGACVDEALAILPDYVPALHHRGLFLLHRERYADAEAVFSEILARDPGHHDARGRRAHARLMQVPQPIPTAIMSAGGITFRHEPSAAEHQERIEAAAADTAHLPDSHPDAVAGRAVLAFFAGDYATARDLLAPHVAEQPYRARERLMLAHAQLVSGEFEGAERNATVLAERGFEEAAARLVRAYARAGTGRLKEAVEDARAVLARHPDWTAQRNFLAFWLLQLGEPREAVAEYDRTLEDEPDNVTYLLGRSTAHQVSGDMDAALRDARRACELDPLNAEAHYQRGGALMGRPEAIDAFDRAVELDPDYVSAIGRRGFARLMLEQFPEAEADARAAAAREPEYGPWRFLLGVALMQQDRYAAAEEALTGALELGMRDGRVYETRGKVRYLRDDCHGALADFEKAVSLGEAVDPALLEKVRRECGE